MNTDEQAKYVSCFPLAACKVAVDPKDREEEQTSPICRGTSLKVFHPVTTTVWVSSIDLYYDHSPDAIQAV